MKIHALGHISSRRTLVVALLMGLFALGVYATYAGFTTQRPGANDFYSRWVGGCALLCEGQNPYSEAVSLRIQEGVYGRPALPHEDQVAFAYPVYCLIFFFPLCLLTNYALVQAIWLWLLLAALLLAALLWLDLIGWRPPHWLRMLTLLWAVLMYHSFRALVLGQFAVLVLLSLVVALWAMQRRRDGWAGFCLALCTVKPQLVYLAIPWLLLWAAGQRRWRLCISFGVSMLLLILGSAILLPSWIPDFIGQATAYPSYTVYGSLSWIMTQHWLGLGSAGEVTLMVLLALCILVMGWRLWRGTWEQMIWMLGLLLLLTNFFTPRIATTNYLLLVPWALLGFQWMQAQWQRWGVWAVAAAQLASLAGLWLLFFTTLKGDFERAPAYVPFPMLMLFLLAWGFGHLETQPASSPIPGAGP